MNSSGNFGRCGVALILVIFFALPTVTSTHAETPTGIGGVTTIAIVDVQKIAHESSAGKGLQIQYDKQREAFSEKVAKLEADLDVREQELSRQRTVLTQDAFNAERQKLESYSAETQEQIQQQGQTNQKAFNDASADLVSTIRDIVASVAREKNVSIVLSQEQTLYIGNGTIDITDTVLDRLNSFLPTITIVVPPQGPEKLPEPSAPAPDKH